MYKLYYSPGACSMAPHVILNEIGAPFEAVKTDLKAGDNRKPEFLKLNPRGQVPLLVEEDGTPLKEGAAIIIHLCEKHGSPLLPREGADRARALEWLCWGNASLHPAYGRVFWMNKNMPESDARADAQKTACDNIQKLWDEADAQLAKTPYLAGKECTAADILMAVIANWTGGMPYPVTLGENVRRTIKSVIARPAYQKALQTEHVEYKAAA